MSRTIVDVQISDVLHSITGSVDVAGPADWWRILAAKVSHDHFDWLADKIAAEGFTVPIVLIERSDGDGYTMGNGHHRLCAAILLGLDTVPVIYTDHAWDYVAESHDGAMELDAPSFEYWELLSQNMEGDHYGDCDAQAWRNQYEGQDEYGSSSPCDCDECQPQEAEPCAYCGVMEDESTEYDDHMPGCPEYDYRRLWCDYCGASHFGWVAVECAAWVSGQHAMALVEHRDRGYYPPGVWHPAGVLDDAYEAHAEWLRDAELRAARYVWENAVQQMRQAVERGASEYMVTRYAERLAEAYAAYSAL